MLALATSALHDYPLIWRRDPALRQPELPPEVAPLPDESPEAFEARKEARDAVVKELLAPFDAAWARAVETRQWDDLKVPGATPTIFWCRQIPGPRLRAMIDYTGRRPDIGGTLRPYLAFRLAVVRIDNYFTGHKVELVDHLDENGERTGLGKVLSDAVIEALDAYELGLVTMLGYSILANRTRPHPL